ncbi:MAG: hypothetical protein AB1736_05675 [Chloroflexota bacterium]
MTQPSLTPVEFARTWRGVSTTERASAQSHVIDLCRMLGEPTPHEADPTNPTSPPVRSEAPPGQVFDDP